MNTHPIVFEYPFEVRQRDVAQFDRITPGALYGSLQDAGLAHSAARGLSGPEMLELGYLWMLNRIHLSIDTAPVLLDQLTIRTWGSNFSGLYAVREYHMMNQDDEIVVRATSRFLTIDIAKKRAVRIPEFVERNCGVQPVRGIDNAFERMRLEPDAEHSKTFVWTGAISTAIAMRTARSTSTGWLTLCRRTCWSSRRSRSSNSSTRKNSFLAIGSRRTARRRVTLSSMSSAIARARSSRRAVHAGVNSLR